MDLAPFSPTAWLCSIRLVRRQGSKWGERCEETKWHWWWKKSKLKWNSKRTINISVVQHLCSGINKKQAALFSSRLPLAHVDRILMTRTSCCDRKSSVFSVTVNLIYSDADLQLCIMSSVTSTLRVSRAPVAPGHKFAHSCDDNRATLSSESSFLGNYMRIRALLILRYAL